jgi:hypothetical protein
MLAKSGITQRLFVSLKNLHLHYHSIFLDLLLAKLLERGGWDEMLLYKVVVVALMLLGNMLVCY